MTDQASTTSSPATESTGTNATGQTGSPPYGMYVALAAVILMSLVAFSAMLIFRDLFENGTEVGTVLGSLFAVVGTVVGAYFGIKTSGDTRDAANETRKELQEKIDSANDLLGRALAHLDRETAERILRDVNEAQR